MKMEHITACLKHDAIYEPLSANNERKSAEWAVFFLAINF
jgi:hypothetical protein